MSLPVKSNGAALPAFYAAHTRFLKKENTSDSDARDTMHIRQQHMHIRIMFMEEMAFFMSMFSLLLSYIPTCFVGIMLVVL